MASDIEQRITRLAARQHGVLTRAQLIGAGVTPAMIRTRLTSKRLVPLHRGIYLLGALIAGLEPRLAREMGAVLACGAGAVVSHRTVAWMWELLRPPPDRTRRPVEVTLPCDVRRRRPGIVAYRARLDPADVTTLDGVPVTMPARTLRDLSPLLSTRELEHAAARALRRELIRDDELPAIVAAHAGRPGAPLLRAALTGNADPAFTRSRAEELFLAMIRSADLPTPRANVLVLGYEVDFLWPDARVIVEIDGFRYHRSRRPFDNDHQRDIELSAAGYQVVRVSWRQLVRAGQPTVTRLIQILTRAEARVAAGR